MLDSGFPLFAWIGFFLAAYAVIANDSIQTLGTYLRSNQHRPWWHHWLFASSILVAALVYAQIFKNGDIADGKLVKLPFPDEGIAWWHTLPPLVLLGLTRFKIPVSTTFLVLTVFAMSGGSKTAGVMPKMLGKSLLGYVVAFAIGFSIYRFMARLSRGASSETPESKRKVWTIFQALTTGFLWWVWLMQDFANIFVFLPRTNTIDAAGNPIVTFDPLVLAVAGFIMVVLQGRLFKIGGGRIQDIVNSKSNLDDVRAATICDLVYAGILLIFKEASNIPMSTTWVFLGLLASREIAITLNAPDGDLPRARKDALQDAGRAALGLVISVVLAISLPWLATGRAPVF